MAKIITGNQDGENGENESYRIPGRGTEIPRKTLVQEIETGKHPNHSIYTRNGEKYVRANPDSKKKNNVNEE